MSMRTIARRGYNNIFSIVAASVILPETISDDFSVDSGWLDGDLNPAAMTITASGRGIWTPTE